jgi:hypothetical protein
VRNLFATVPAGPVSPNTPSPAVPGLEFKISSGSLGSSAAASLGLWGSQIAEFRLVFLVNENVVRERFFESKLKAFDYLHVHVIPSRKPHSSCPLADDL